MAIFSDLDLVLRDKQGVKDTCGWANRAVRSKVMAGEVQAEAPVSPEFCPVPSVHEERSSAEWALPMDDPAPC
ncbi:hypothetical protein CCR75_004033 [Bremia lactucae]|uniref:Uncharacterized protein n=1 Tax=Bremia lactucae TaxID=4779 RepID=A0A976FN71_BRELC|nr:hypothetical protein CCR75_004033 [Bremia lactucae]